MKSIKPGRGPSAQGVIGAIIACIFGVFWIITAVQMGAPIIFPVFGVMFIGMSIFQGVYNYKNATGKNRYSAFDIVDDDEESDPMQKFIKNDDYNQSQVRSSEMNYCPYCGNSIESNFKFCPKCGKTLPN